MIGLANPSFLLIGIIFLPLFFKREARFLGYSHLGFLEADSGPGIWLNLPRFVSFVAIGLLIVGLARPQWQRTLRQERFLARDIILVIDLSYSMENKYGTEAATGGADAPRKIDVAKKAALQFVGKRKQDRIGLVVFGDETFGSWPLTRDLGLISKKLDRLGSTFYGGTNLVSPFVKTMDHFREMGQSENRVLVFLSDGEATIAPETKEMIVRDMGKMGIHLYLVGINLKREYSDILDVVDRTGGRFITTESSKELDEAFDEIDRLEPSVVQIAVQGEKKDLYPLFVFSALCLMVGTTLLGSTLFIELC